MTLKERAKQLKQDIPAVFLTMKSKDTPFLAKLCAGITVAYALSPIDLVPDFIPVLGYLDDILLLSALVALTIRLIPPNVMKDCKIEAAEIWKEGKPRRWYFALPIAAVWLLVIGLLVRAFL